LEELNARILDGDGNGLTSLEVYNAMKGAKDVISEIFEFLFPESAEDGVYTRVPLYCHCKSAFSAYRAMIQCDACKEWFHLECEGVSIPENKYADVYTYVCSLCDPTHQPKVVFKSFSTISYFNRPSSISDKAPRKKSLPKSGKGAKNSDEDNIKVKENKIEKTEKKSSSRRRKAEVQDEEQEEEEEVVKKREAVNQLEPISLEDAAAFEKDGKKLKSLEAVVREGGVMKTKRERKRPISFTQELQKSEKKKQKPRVQKRNLRSASPAKPAKRKYTKRKSLPKTEDNSNLPISDDSDSEKTE
jgi:hypothetical protein